jgi:hypothetical protein
LQDRLVKEMRLRGISSREAANAFLREYLPGYNRRFGVRPANTTDVHVKLERGFNLGRYLCLKTDRTVRNDHTVAYDGKLYQITEPVLSRTVIVEQRCDGSVQMISAGGMSLKYREITGRPQKATPPEPPRRPRQPRLPARDHPWRTSPLKTVVRKTMYTQTSK